MGDVVLQMSLAHASTLAVAARAIADTAAGLGLGGSQRTQLEALLSEALTAVIADSFEDSESIDVDVSVSHEPGQIDIVLNQRGAPSTYVSGQLPTRLETLVSLGYADSLQFVSEGVRGSELRIRRTVSAGKLIDDADFVADSQERGEPAINIEDVDIRPITTDDVIEVARLYFRVYGYTKIGSPWIYEPDVFIHKLEGDLHDATIAVTPSGRVVGHLGLLRERPDSPTAAGGPMAVEPAYRGQGLADKMAQSFLPRVLQMKLRGTYGEAVTAHPASQKSAIKLGGREVGLILGRQPADLDFLGFDGPKGFRRAVMLLYTPYTSPPLTTAHVPQRYLQITTRIYEHCNLPRTVVAKVKRPPSDLAPESRFNTELTAATKFARVTVEEYGADFVEALQGLLLRYKQQQFEAITVHLPLGDPLTSYFGAGLGELGLSFYGIFPEQQLGDELILGVCFTEQDPETVAVASEFGAELRDFVFAERDSVVRAAQSHARSRAALARILDGL